jgi:FimV-like protein
VPARIDLARLYLAQGKTGKAREEAEEVLRTDPANAQARAILSSMQ